MFELAELEVEPGTGGAFSSQVPAPRKTGLPRAPHTDTELAGVVDGVLAHEGVLSGAPGQPFLLVMEAKRGWTRPTRGRSSSGRFWRLLWAKIAHVGDAAPAEAFGCFTVGDIWTFVRAEAVVRAAGTVPRLAVTLSWSREFTERTEANAILRVLSWITGQAEG